LIAIDIRGMEQNSEGLVEITTIINYVPEEEIIPNGDKYQRLILKFNKLGYFESEKFFFMVWILIKTYYLYDLIGFHIEYNLLDTQYIYSLDTYLTFDSFNETIFSYVYLFTNRTAFKKKEIKRMNAYFVLCLNLKKKHPFMNMVV